MEHDSSFNKQLRKEIKEIPFENTKNAEKQKEDNEINLSLFLDLAEENKIIYNQAPANTLIEAMKKMKNALFTNGYFTLGEEAEIDTNRVLKIVINEPSLRQSFGGKQRSSFYLLYIKIYRYFRNFKRVNSSAHERGANEYNNILEYVGENCYIPNGNGCFLKCITYFAKKDVSMEYLEFIQSYERKTNVMTRGRKPEFCKRYKIDIVIYDPKGKRLLPWSFK